jgi:hypothetical protein
VVVAKNTMTMAPANERVVIMHADIEHKSSSKEKETSSTLSESFDR